VILSSELSNEFWGLALVDATDIRESLPSSKNPLVSRAVAWGKSKSNLKKSPLIPFGSRVLAHLRLINQTALSGRAFPAIAVGRATGVKGGIKLYYPKTKRVIVRRSFKVLGLVDRRKSSEPGVIDIEISDESGIDELNYDASTNTISGISAEKSGVSKKQGVQSKKSGVRYYRSVLRSELQAAHKKYLSNLKMYFNNLGPPHTKKLTHN